MDEKAAFISILHCGDMILNPKHQRDYVTRSNSTLKDSIQKCGQSNIFFSGSACALYICVCAGFMPLCAKVSTQVEIQLTLVRECRTLKPSQFCQF